MLNSNTDLVQESKISGYKFPLVLQVNSDSNLARDTEAAISWIKKERLSLESKLLKHGCVLLRGFSEIGTDGLNRIADEFGGNLLDYLGGATPRGHLGGKIYESTQWPSFFKIKLHNEMSYLRDYPDKIFFYCDTPSMSGGETILCDMREIYKGIDAEVREEFISKKVMYVRTFQGASPIKQWVKKAIGNNMHRTWMDAFGTHDRNEVEDICRSQGLDVEWFNKDWLKVTNILPATIEHPVSGDQIWFNQVTSMHPNKRSLGLVYKYLEWMYPDETYYPFNVYYGDGSSIPADKLTSIYDAMEANTVSYPWQKGDLLILDNRIISHGRNPFKGNRKILVSLLTQPKLNAIAA